MTRKCHAPYSVEVSPTQEANATGTARLYSAPSERCFLIKGDPAVFFLNPVSPI